MKKIIVIACFVMVCFLSACTGNSAKDIEKAENAYEAMSCAVDEGNWQKAMEYYDNGASDSGNENSADLYYHALAMKSFSEKGCLGQPYDLTAHKSSIRTQGSESIINQIRTHTEIFDGAYQRGSHFYVYFSQGKIAGKEAEQLSGEAYCTGELVVIEGVYYWAEHNDSGADTLLYLVEKTQNGIKLTAVDNSNNIFEGEYQLYTTDMPQLKY